MSVKGRVAIVTGAGGGLGREYALLLGKLGAKVVVNDYGGTLEGQPGTISRAQSVVDEIRAAGGSAIADGHDVSIQTQAEAIVTDCLAEYGRVDILVNNAGISGKPSSHAALDAPAFMRVIEIGVLGTQLMTSAVWSTMEKQGHGRIVNVSSDAIIGFGAGGDCAYSASKGAVFAITQDLGRFSPSCGIKLNAILPSGASRMGDLSEASKMITQTYFETRKFNGDTAEGRCYLWFSATMDTSKPHEYHAFGGHYRFKFQRTDKGWKISRMQLKKIWAQNEDTERVFG
ncbi:hypothetical protein HZS61_003435 [Fusarium oxysporum f. sp. conglutinans]|uniref:SnoaL-like domain-containing protein n=1 Tax=Fusarium oxysporum f. sp. conglutinans TaxID=100902 RepID=A0A8H6GED3_FUSOX|nr:hypothetical protein HZS61_003435 [Fusarium oxysporum f. sp. conglutinans]